MTEPTDADYLAVALAKEVIKTGRLEAEIQALKALMAKPDEDQPVTILHAVENSDQT